MLACVLKYISFSDVLEASKIKPSDSFYTINQSNIFIFLIYNIIDSRQMIDIIDEEWLFHWQSISSHWLLNHLFPYTIAAATIMWILVTVSAIDPGLVWSAPCLLTRPHSTAWLRRLGSSFLQHQFIAEAGTPDEVTHCHHYYVYFRHSNLDNGSLHLDKGLHGGMSARPATLQCLAPPWLRSSAVQHQICD